MTDSINAEIDRLLAERRPDRYTTGADDSAAWLDAIADEIAPLIHPSTAQQRAARTLVGQREGRATRTTNKILRDCLGQPPLDWEFFRGLPIVVGNERVAIRAATDADFLQFAREERARNAEEFTTREQTVRGAEFLAEYMRANGIASGAGLTW